jgi:hypothetical protein
VTGEGTTPHDAEVPTRPGLCENCARHDGELVAVRRVYVTPESWDTSASSTVMDEVEWWCFTCRSMYPHRVAGGHPQG